MRSRIKTALFILVAVCMLTLVLLPSMALAAEGDAGLVAPHRAKTIRRNSDGTYRVTLSMTGDTAQSSRTQSANVVVLQDVSTSMNQPVGGYIEIEGAPDWEYGHPNYFGLVNGRYVQLARFSGEAGYWIGRTWHRYGGRIYAEKTRLDVGKQALMELGDYLLGDSAQANVTMSLIPFGTRSQVIGTYSKGDAEAFKSAVRSLSAPFDNGTNWAYALWQANQIARASPGKPTYIIFLSDGQPTLRGGWNGTAIQGSGSSDPNGANLNAALGQLTAQSRAPDLKAVFSVYTAHEARGSMDSFASRTDLPSNHAYDGTNLEDLKGALREISRVITGSVGYANVSLNDGLSENVEYVGNVFCSYADPNGQVASWDAATDRFEYDPATKRASWSLVKGADRLPISDSEYSSAVGVPKGYTYFVSFDVKLSDAARKKAAENGSVDLPTNTEGTGDDGSYVQYDVVNTIDGQTTTTVEGARAGYPTPSVPVSRLVLGKTVTGNLSDTDQRYDFTATFPAGRYYLSRSGSSSSGVVPAEGPVDLAGGTYSFTLSHGETLAIGGLVSGDQVKIAESRPDVAGSTTTATLNGGQLELQQVADSEGKNLTLTGSATFPRGQVNGSGIETTIEQNVQFTNDATAAPPTGIDTSSRALYAALLGLGLVAAAAFGIKLRICGKEV